MKKQGQMLAPLAAALFGTILLTATPASAAPASGSDDAFNAMVLEMSGQDTGSAWFDYYVETVNQHIAYKGTEEAFGAAGPGGPLAGFDGYIAGFVEPDTGSQWFNAYVDGVRRILRAKETPAL